MIHTVRHCVPENSPLAGYFLDTGHKCTNLYNRAMFLTRQAMTGSKKKHKDRYPNEHKAFRDFRQARETINKTRKRTHKAALAKARAAGDTAKEAKLLESGPDWFRLPDARHWYVGSMDMMAVLQALDDPDYRTLQSNHAQHVVRQAGDAWTSYFEGLKSWKACPEKFTGMPKPPYYRETGSWSTIVYSNQNCRFVHDEKSGRAYLTFPYTKERLDVTGLLTARDVSQYRLCGVKVAEKPHGYEVHISYDDGQDAPAAPKAPGRIHGIDFGVDNLVAIANNTGRRPVLIRGGELKSYNQWRNKTAGYYQGRAKTDNRVYATARTEEIWDGSCGYMGNVLRLTANAIMAMLIEDRADALVVGKNDGWKQGSNMGRRNNQNFVQIPHVKLATILKEKCEAAGILYVEQEESYTSKASFLPKGMPYG